MKKTLLIIAVASLTMASCKKDRTCTCTTTNTSSSTNGMPQTLNAPKTEVTKLTKVSKTGADCNSGEITTNYTYVSGNTTYNNVNVDKKDCKLS